MAVDHIDDLQFVIVQLHGGGRTAVLNHDDAEAFIN